MPARPDENEPDLPTTFGEYTLIERLAVGGMAEIYRARTEGLGGFEKILVIKKLHEHLTEDEDFIDMMVDEAKIAVRLNHPNIAKTFDLGCIDGHYFIVMEYIKGPDLSDIRQLQRQDREPLSTPAILFVGAEICAGLHYAHTRRGPDGEPMNIVHRDVSPPNVMLSTEGEVKLVDFGIAKARKRIQETEHGVIKGKFHYMAPEQARGQHLDARTDVFSAGLVVYELLARKNPYDGVAESEMMRTVRTAQIPPIREFRPEIDPDLEAVVMKALQRKRQDRYES
ncbi:MAG: serine/threonine protein kinase, partial [Bradymonadaceae bacterium]